MVELKIDLREFLSQEWIVENSLSIDEMLEKAKSIHPKPIKIFYGETYDSYGNTIDSMKYYFFVAALSDLFRKEGLNTEPTILVADSAAARNVSQKLKEDTMNQGKDRFEFIKKFNKIYGTDLKIELMSSFINTSDFQKKLKEIMKVCKDDPKLIKKIEKSVPESKLEIEREKGFMYSFEELATIIDIDIKVGPPREDLYDNIARELSKKLNKNKELISIYLTPTFPVGVNFDYFLSHPGIEEHGITAYKAGSKRLQENRIIVGKTDSKKAKELIDNSFISEDKELPNPVLDAGLICDMANQRLNDEIKEIKLYEDFYSGKISPKDLKDKVYKCLVKNVLKRFE
jgi:hypothetical protein